MATGQVNSTTLRNFLQVQVQGKSNYVDLEFGGTVVFVSLISLRNFHIVHKVGLVESTLFY